ncbi:MAG: FomA family porin-like outer membrane protein [Cetobacterium sp.]|uniref:FomA family porin-like outer membrane protein n=1 Tax=Cetobacterium sp. TaxID=2071632 RepID=UPI003F2A1A0B
MKKLALLLGSLLVVGATASAKEAVVAPVEVSKEVVVVAEPVVEVVVEEAFRPTGYIGLEYKAYGTTEGHKDYVPTENRDKDNDLNNVSQDSWNKGSNNYSRLQTTFGVQMTEKSRLEGRIRDYNNLERSDDSNGTKRAGTETRLRYFYKHNDTLTSRVQYRDEEDNSQNFEYMLRVNAYKNSGALLSSVVVAPKVYHSLPTNGGGNYTNMLGANVEFAGNLPLGFTWDGTLFLEQSFYNHDRVTGVNSTFDKSTSTTDKSFDVAVELYLYRSFGLYSNEATNLDFNMVAGLDPYKFRQYDMYSYGKDTPNPNLPLDKNAYPKGLYSKTSRNTYEAQLVLDVTATHQFTPAITLKAGVGAEYRNWDNVSQDSAKDWRWQPFAFGSMNVKF